MIKFLHTSDWHLGKIIHGRHMTDDQRYVLNQLIKYIEVENIDVIGIAGDIFDRSIPPLDAIKLFEEFLLEIVIKQGRKVVVIAGNHDSATRLAQRSKMLEAQGLYIVGPYKGIETITLTINDEQLAIHCYPYIEPQEARRFYENVNLKSHDLVFETAFTELAKTDADYQVFMGHGYYTFGKSLEESDSERPLSIGGTANIHGEPLKAFDYVALGHLHRYQCLVEEKVFYSGSLLNYSFSEVNTKPRCNKVSFSKDKGVQVAPVFYELLRDMRIIEGTIDELLANTSDDYILARLTDKGKIDQPFARLKLAYPNLLKLERPRKEVAEVKTVDREQLHQLSLDKMFEHFYTSVSGDALGVEDREAISEMMALMKKVEE